MAARGGIDLGGTKIQAVVIDTRGEVVGQSRRPTPRDGGPAAVVEAMGKALTEAATSADTHSGRLSGVGVGSPGEVDPRSGTVTQARNLPDWEGSFPLAAELAELLGTPVSVGNDVQVSTDAEFQLGAGRPYRSLLGVFWGTGVGGGLVLDGKPWAGRGAAGEIGHVVVKQDGALCPCGRAGCMEAYAGRGAMEARARRKKGKTKLFEIMEDRDKERLTSGVWARAAKNGDKVAVKLLDRAIAALGAGVGSAVNILDPQAVVIGGGMGTRFGEEYVERIRQAMRPHVFFEAMPEVHLAELGDLGGAMGAALLAPKTRSRRAPAGRRGAKATSTATAKGRQSTRRKAPAKRSRAAASRS